MLGAALVCALDADARAEAATQALKGLVLPRVPAPDLPLTDTFGRSIGLSAQLRGKVTAVQLMFAGCSSTCPIQGAVFAAVAQKVRATDVHLLSLTVDPLSDSPQALRDWLGRFGQHRFWTAGAPRMQDVDVLAEFLRGAPPRTGTHSSQVFLFDRQARLAFRTVELPSAEHVAELLTMLAAA
ncbi:MAG: SCO family protein [Rubrivivax sp.]|nr:SCO family protein [Rubrivivax sp.]